MTKVPPLLTCIEFHIFQTAIILVISLFCVAFLFLFGLTIRIIHEC